MINSHKRAEVETTEMKQNKPRQSLAIAVWEVRSFSKSPWNGTVSRWKQRESTESVVADVHHSSYHVWTPARLDQLSGFRDWLCVLSSNSVQ